MALLVCALVLGLAVGLARGGSLAALGRIRLIRGWLVALAAVVLVVGALGGAGLYAVTSVAAVLLIAPFLAANRRLPGLGLLALGLTLNAVVVVANAAMPVSLYAAGRAGVSAASLVGDPRHVAADSSTRLRPLGDVVALPTPVLATVVSPGDVAVAAGLALFAAVAPVRARRTLAQRRAALVPAADHPPPARVPVARPVADPPDPAPTTGSGTGPVALTEPARIRPYPPAAGPPVARETPDRSVPPAPGEITVEQLDGHETRPPGPR